MKGAAPRVVRKGKPETWRCPVCRDALPSDLVAMKAEALRHRAAHARKWKFQEVSA